MQWQSFDETGCGRNPCGKQDHICSDARAVLEHDVLHARIAGKLRHLLVQSEGDAMALVQALKQRAEAGAELTLEGHFLRGHDGDLSATLAQR